MALFASDLPGYPEMSVALPPGTAYRLSVGMAGAPMLTKLVSAIDCPAMPEATGGSGVALKFVISCGVLEAYDDGEGTVAVETFAPMFTA